MNNEADVKRHVKSWLKQNGWMFWMPPGNGFGTVGVADFSALYKGVFLAVETKFGTRKPTDMQLRFIKSVRQHGGFAIIVRDSTLLQFQQFVSMIEATKSLQGVGDTPALRAREAEFV